MLLKHARLAVLGATLALLAFSPALALAGQDKEVVLNVFGMT